jgi:hypothetical protein
MCNTGVSRKKIKEVILETSAILFHSPHFGKYMGIKYFLSGHSKNIIRKFIFLFPFGRKLFKLKNN